VTVAKVFFFVVSVINPKFQFVETDTSSCVMFDYDCI
jgi:hypothetical protein